MKRFFITLSFGFLLCQATAQSTNIGTLLHNNINKADHYFDQLAYRNALNVYLHAFEKDPSNYHVRERIGECYFKLHDPANAEVWLGPLAKEGDIHPEPKFEYAEALSMNGKYAESLFWFEEYQKDRPNDELVKEKIRFLKDIKKYTEGEQRYVVAGADFINTSHSEYGAHYFHDGIVFASSRDKDTFIEHKPFDAVHPDESLLNLYFAARKVTGDWENVRPFHAQALKSYWHEGPIAFFDNYKKAAFTRSNVQNGKPVYDALGRVNLQIYFAEVAHLGEMKNIVPFEYNNDGYSTAHPCFSSDGKTMFFTSGIATGKGGSDIFYSTFENGRWTEPVSVEGGVNTREDESFPFLANDTTLYFTSNGHGTLGGLDIYVSYKRNGKFTKPANLGSSVNSQYDDFSLVCDSTGRVGYFASNRPGGKGLDDIYFYISHFYFLAGEVRELSKEQAHLPGTVVKAYNSNGDLVDSTRADSQGYFSLNLPYDQDYLLYGERDGFEAIDGMPFSTRGKPFGVDSLMLPMWKHKLFAKGKIYNNEAQEVLPGAKVKLYNLTDNRIDEVVVNENGEYNFLVLPNRKYKVEASKEGFINDGFDLNTHDIYEGELLNDIVLEEVYIEKEMIFFDFDKADVSDISMRDMSTVLRTLKKYPKATLYIGAHADSRGTAKYNKSLSERRAAVAKAYFVKNGISGKRIDAHGFGEELILNKCSDGVGCPEEEHSKNRRAEIKVLNITEARRPRKD